MVSLNEFFSDKGPEYWKNVFSYGFTTSTHFDSANITALYLNKSNGVVIENLLELSVGIEDLQADLVQAL
jgi:hypothetical protein